MSLLWAVAPVVVLVGAALVVVLLHRIVDAAGELADQLHRLGEIHEAVAAVRTGSAAGHASVEELRRR
ncbi:hypothetical protein BH20ACT2_BH20ACT2_06430 [soil metagenome]